MKTIFKTIKATLFILFVFALAGCSSGIKKFKVDNIQTAKGVSYEPYFNKSEIAPLKSEWKELYIHLKKGHLLRSIGDSEINYIYSYQLYKLLKSNLLKIYSTPFLQDYNNFIAVFGEPSIVQEVGDKMTITYSKSVIGDPCQTCNHDLFGYTFDKSSQKLLKE
jgi:hypothetical protein